MTDNDVERIAREAGCFTPGASRNYWAVTDPMLRKFAELVQAEQRERCATAIEALAEGWGDQAEEYGMRLAASEARKA